jgi:hypothetical protein
MSGLGYCRHTSAGKRYVDSFKFMCHEQYYRRIEQIGTDVVIGSGGAVAAVPCLRALSR